MPTPPAAFQFIARQSKELARNATQCVNEKNRPLISIDTLLLGNIIDPLHSTLWLEKNPGEPGCVRPWTDFRASEHAFKFSDSIRAILKSNFEIWSESFPDQSSPLTLS